MKLQVFIYQKWRLFFLVRLPECCLLRASPVSLMQKHPRELPASDKASWNRIVFIYVDIINTTGFIDPFIPIIYHPLPAYPC